MCACVCIDVIPSLEGTSVGFVDFPTSGLLSWLSEYSLYHDCSAPQSLHPSKWTNTHVHKHILTVNADLCVGLQGAGVTIPLI